MPQNWTLSSNGNGFGALKIFLSTVDFAPRPSYLARQDVGAAGHNAPRKNPAGVLAGVFQPPRSFFLRSGRLLVKYRVGVRLHPVDEGDPHDFRD